jgi:hypothetical protein
MTTVQTNTSQIHFIEVNEESREVRFEYGTQLMEYTFLLLGEISVTVFLQDLINSVDEGNLSKFLEAMSNNSNIVATGEFGFLSAPMLLALDASSPSETV